MAAKNHQAETGELRGKIALVAGASRGIGKAIAAQLAAAGAKLVLSARDEKALNKAAADIARRGADPVAIPCDFTDLDHLAQLVSQVKDQAGVPDILVYAAGTTIRKTVLEITPAEWDEVMDVNLKGAAFTARAVGQAMIKKKKPGALIFIASLLARAARPTILPYTVSKAGISSLVQGLAVEWARSKIRVNAIAPGYIKTDLTRPLYTNPDFTTWVKEKTPQGRWGLPEDIAPVALFLASDASRFITGQTIFVDGGWSAVL